MSTAFERRMAEKLVNEIHEAIHKMKMFELHHPYVVPTPVAQTHYETHEVAVTTAETTPPTGTTAYQPVAATETKPVTTSTWHYNIGHAVKFLRGVSNYEKKYAGTFEVSTPYGDYTVQNLAKHAAKTIGPFIAKMSLGLTKSIPPQELLSILQQAKEEFLNEIGDGDLNHNGRIDIGDITLMCKIAYRIANEFANKYHCPDLRNLIMQFLQPVLSFYMKVVFTGVGRNKFNRKLLKEDAKGILDTEYGAAKAGIEAMLS